MNRRSFFARLSTLLGAVAFWRPKPAPQWSASDPELGISIRLVQRFDPLPMTYWYDRELAEAQQVMERERQADRLMFDGEQWPELARAARRHQS